MKVPKHGFFVHSQNCQLNPLLVFIWQPFSFFVLLIFFRNMAVFNIPFLKTIIHKKMLHYEIPKKDIYKIMALIADYHKKIKKIAPKKHDSEKYFSVGLKFFFS